VTNCYVMVTSCKTINIGLETNVYCLYGTKKGQLVSQLTFL